MPPDSVALSVALYLRRGRDEGSTLQHVSSCLENTDGHGHAGHRDQVPLHPLLAGAETALVVNHPGVVLLLQRAVHGALSLRIDRSLQNWIFRQTV